MKLKELLRLIESDDEFIPSVIKYKNGNKTIDCRPNSVFKITICPMCEEETWLTVSIYHPILVPWYSCEVSGITPQDDESVQVWLQDVDFLFNNYKEDIVYVKDESD